MCLTVLRSGKQNNRAIAKRSPKHVLTTISSKKKNWKGCENCQKSALKSPCNACTWHAGHFSGRYTNWDEQSQNAQELVTEAWLVRSSGYKKSWHVEILQSIADWDCSTILILVGIFKTQNRLRVYDMYLRESNVRSHKLDVHETNFSFTQFYWIWGEFKMQVCAWTVSQLFISGIWFLKYYMVLQFDPDHGATSCVVNTVKNIPTNERTTSLTRRKIFVGQTLISSLQTQNLLILAPCFAFFWGQGSSNEDDYQRQKSVDETCVPYPLRCARLAIW